MSEGTVEERLDRLEKVVEGVVDRLSRPADSNKDWQRTIGMFDGDPVMREIIDEALRARDEERKRFYSEYDRRVGHLFED